MPNLSLPSFTAVRNCLLCHAPTGGRTCPDCLDDLLSSAMPQECACPQCGGLGGGAEPCLSCQKHPPPFDKLWSSAYYEAPLNGILHEYKYRRRIELRFTLAELMLHLPPPWLEETRIECVLAVPLSRERRLERGFNQCGELARILAAHHGLPILPENTVFRRPAPPQSSLPLDRRQHNASGVFRTDGDVEDLNILLIDDVATTNATLAELCRILKQAGARHLYCWTLMQAKMQRF